jgi:hypothetical protein
MEQQNDVTTQQGSEDLQGMYAAYKKSMEKKKKLTKEEILAKYFTPRRDKEIFRALPAINKDASIPLIDRYFEKAFFHEVKTGPKKYRKVYCPANNDPKVQAVDKNGQPVVDQNGAPVMVSAPCPLCKKAKALLATQDRSLLPKIKGKKKEEIEKILTPQEKAIHAENRRIYEAGSKLEAKKFYVLRGIDRGAEKDGVKFWRFKHNFKNQGTYDKLMGITEDYSLQHGNFTDVNKGTDFTIIVIDAQLPGKNYTYRDISAIIPRGPSKLHTDSTIEKAWLEDKTQWRDVFKPAVAPKITSLKFLELAAEDAYDANGFVIGTNAPYFDESDPQNKKWVFPNHPELEAEANRRDDNLEADGEDYGYDEENEYASAATTVVNNSSKPDITNIGDSDVKNFNHGSVNIGTAPTANPSSGQPAKQDAAYDDLPF